MKRTVCEVLGICRASGDEEAKLPAGGEGWLCLVIFLGAGVYGAVIGLWRAPLQAVFTFLKFPLLLLATAGANALLNGLLAQRLGSGLSFRESTRAILTASAVFALILAALSPVALFILLNTPPLDAAKVLLSHNFLLLLHVAVIAFAGVVAHVRLLQVLARACGARGLAARVLAAWLAGNLFLGCQLSWILRPFIGSPGLPVEFLRSDAFSGNFYESVWRALSRLLGS